MDNRGPFLFLLLTFYLLLSSLFRAPLVDHNGEREKQLAEEEDALKLLNESRYGDFSPSTDAWLPIPGLRQNDTYSWDLLPTAQERARRNLHFALESGGIKSPPELDIVDQAPSVKLSSFSLPVYHNVTGKLRGDWVRHSLPHESRLNVSALVEENFYMTNEFGLNVTGDSGSVYVNFQEGNEDEAGAITTPPPVREIRAEVAIESDSALGNTWYMATYGLHFPEQGSIIMTTTSEKFGGLLSLPHLALSQDTFNLSHQVIVKSLAGAIVEKQNNEPTFFPWSSLPRGAQAMAFPTPKCEYIIYIQQRPVRIGDSLAEPAVLEQIERELRFPTGAPIPSPPMMEMSVVIFSPDCGILLETKGAPDYAPTDSLYLFGAKHEEYSKYASRTVYAMGFIIVGQLYLLLRQIKEASTPSTRSRVSFFSIAMMALGDSMVMSLTLLSLFADTSFIEISAASFLVFLSVGYIGMRFMMEVWAVQVPERREQERQATPNPTNPRMDTLPAPVTATRAINSGATPIILPSDQDELSEAPAEPVRTPAAGAGRNPTPSRAEVGADVGTMYARFYFVLCCLSVVSLWSFVFPNKVAAVYARLVSFLYLSFWVPQIYRNIMRNCRKALRWEFVIGQSILRLIPFTYFLTAPGNVLFIRPDTTTALAMIAWVWLQTWILGSQDILGPRFFVPNGWAPPAYDYHPIIRDTSATGTGEDVESGTTLPIGSLRAEERDASSSATQQQDKDRLRPKDKKKKIFDCAICMQDIEVTVISSPSVAGSSVTDGASSILGRRAYMVTPCRHIFHSTCLESWMKLRLQCPICRESIPPV
ncbi:uncharacterized protein TRUGW13939_11326 [Talaromyces rugulosus]|uniref:DSC E3 ubiquitin ligase complex subunit A n=1 Tax=Talaromyces rugulosus TaxID=121627 RepID=A0A7H8RHV0_TALRU|nr:uncharacterized protein TRUGW13939_11326 [Talaromyces rugulosus]QKX64153.1 hypothetical protein TRUGW13939_11326 [Talaromyces rugulosus]